MRLAVFSAFPQELKATGRGLKADKSFGEPPLAIFSASYSSREILLVQTGMGSNNTEAAFQSVFEKCCPDFIVSVGFGGALYEGARVGDLVWASRVLFYEENSTEAIEIPGADEIEKRLSGKVTMCRGYVLTLGRWTKKSELKQFLPKGLPFPVCDMETFALGKLSVSNGLPFFAVRSVTDLADEDISRDLFDVCDESGSYRFPCALRLFLGNPKLILEGIKLGIAAKIASRNLWSAVKALIEVL